LESCSPDKEVAKDVEQLYDYIVKHILWAATQSIPYRFVQPSKSKLPMYIVDLIKERKKAYWRWRRSHPAYIRVNKTEYNRLSALVRREIVKFRSLQWEKFLNVEQSKGHLLSSRPLWKRINQFRTGPKSNTFPSDGNLLPLGTRPIFLE
jgi:hypothetical protein